MNYLMPCFIGEAILKGTVFKVYSKYPLLPKATLKKYLQQIYFQPGWKNKGIFDLMKLKNQE